MNIIAVYIASAKWGKIEERAFLNTYGEIQEGYIPDDDGKYPKDNIGTYSTSVYTERKNCDKFINMLKKSVRLRKVYPFPVIIVGNTSNGLVQRTADRDSELSRSNTRRLVVVFREKRNSIKQFCIMRIGVRLCHIWEIFRKLEN